MTMDCIHASTGPQVVPIGIVNSLDYDASYNVHNQHSNCDASTMQISSNNNITEQPQPLGTPTRRKRMLRSDTPKRVSDIHPSYHDNDNRSPAATTSTSTTSISSSSSDTNCRSSDQENYTVKCADGAYSVTVNGHVAEQLCIGSCTHDVPLHHQCRKSASKHRRHQLLIHFLSRLNGRV
jgi:hypothetical protein